MNLTVAGFVGDLIEMYPKAFVNPEKWIERYTDALNSVGTINFKKLWQIYDNEYLSSVTPPPVKWVKEAARRARVSTNTAEKYETLTAVDANGVYEFAYFANEPMPDIEKRIKNCLFWWKGGYWDCPNEYKQMLEEVTKAQKEKVLKMKPGISQEELGITNITVNDIIGVDSRPRGERN